MARKFSRRDFLKLASLSISAAAFRTLSPTDLLLPQPLTSLGRITLKQARVLNRPHRLGESIGYKGQDEILTVYRAVVGEGFYPHNHVWIEIPEGFVYSSWVQPVKNEPQTPLTALPADSFYGEISVPFTEARAQPDPDAEIAYRMYYSVVLKVSSIRTGADGAIWYEVDDENLNPTERYWVTGQHLRLITPEEVTPISPDVTDKRIVANIQTHWLSAYEGKAEVFRTRFASGATFFEPDGSKRAAITPGGVHPIWSKRISRHMEGGTPTNGYDVPGVGWVSYWHSNGAAIHSTYWHNDYGRPRSHGCLNCSPTAAKWLFRWTMPVVAYSPGNIEVTWPGGTRVEIEGTPPPLADDAGG
ncbi:MAG TPA: L,D-transpeptidase [Anaerolineales bacterium]|nr:L,D-transpeptidase [Anaerolineales bacterium]